MWTFVGKVMSLFLLSRFVIAFLPRSKCLLISWLQSQRVGRDLVTEQQQQICPLFIAVCTCLVHVRHNYYKKKPGDFPGGPVVKTLCFHCSGGCGRGGFNPWFGELTSHMPRGQENHQKKTTEEAPLSFFLQFTISANVEPILPSMNHSILWENYRKNVPPTWCFIH